MSQTALHCTAMYTFWFSAFQHGQGSGKDGWDGKGAWCRQTGLFRMLSEPVAGPGPELLDLSPRQKFFHYTMKTDQLLPGYSAECPFYNQSGNSFFHFTCFDFYWCFGKHSEGRSARLSGDQSCSTCVLELARAGKLHSSSHHLPGPARERAFIQGAQTPDTTCLGGGQPCAMLAKNWQAQGKARGRNG